MKSVFSDLNKSAELFNELFGYSFNQNSNYKLVQDGEQTVLALSLPGFKKNEIELDVEKDVLTIKSIEEDIKDDYFKKSFSHKFKLNSQLLDINKIKASMEDGVLFVKFENANNTKSKNVKIDVE